MVDSALPASAGRDRLRREILTPEGVVLQVTLAQRGERAAAVIVDLIIIVSVVVALWILAALTFFGAGLGGWGLSFMIIASFAIRSFYFAFFELRWRGATPGKRLMGLRVVDRRGGRLTSEAIFARNLMREVELFIRKRTPMTAYRTS